MPDPPSTSLIARYLLENPWPLGLLLAALTAGLLWTGLREGHTRRLQAAAGTGPACLLVLALGLLVTTPAEHGERVTRELVDAAVEADTVAAFALFADDATMSVGSVTNQRVGADVILSQLDRLATAYRIETNYVTQLDGYTTDDDRAEVHLACLTDAGMGLTPSQWVLIVGRGEDGSWQVEHITCISINRSPPPSNRMW